MNYWIVFKIDNGRFLYISGTDEYGYPEHTEVEAEAWKFKDFNTAMSYFGLGYGISKKFY